MVDQGENEASEPEARRVQAEEHARDLAALGIELPRGFAAKAVRASRDGR